MRFINACMYSVELGNSLVTSYNSISIKELTVKMASFCLYKYDNQCYECALDWAKLAGRNQKHRTIRSDCRIELRNETPASRFCAAFSRFRLNINTAAKLSVYSLKKLPHMRTAAAVYAPRWALLRMLVLHTTTPAKRNIRKMKKLPLMLDMSEICVFGLGPQPPTNHEASLHHELATTGAR